MSDGPRDYVTRYSPYTGAQLAVHHAVADIANPQNQYEFWMNQTELGAMTRLSRPTVHAALDQMVADGYLVELEGKPTRRADRPIRRFRFLFLPGPVVYDDGRDHLIDAAVTPNNQATQVESHLPLDLPSGKSLATSSGPSGKSLATEPKETKNPVSATADTGLPVPPEADAAPKDPVKAALWAVADEITCPVYGPQHRRTRAVMLNRIRTMIAEEWPEEATAPKEQFADFAARCLRRRAKRYQEFWPDINFSIEALTNNWPKLGPKARRPGPPAVR